MNQKRRKIWECTLLLTSIILFTLLFRFESTNIRYFFLLGDVYVIYCFSKALSSLEIKREKRIIKNSLHKIQYQK